MSWVTGIDMLQNVVKKWRLARGVSKAHLARRIGVCRSYVSKLETGNLQPSGDMMFRIAAYFGRRIEEIFQLVPGQPAKPTIFGPKTLPTGNAPTNPEPATDKSCDECRDGVGE